MASHLWAASSPPMDYVELVLCRDVYHCTPVELARVPYVTVMRHLVCIDAENKVRKKRAR